MTMNLGEPNDIVRFASGSTRSKLLFGQRPDEQMPRYDLVSPVGLRRVAVRYAMGAEKHGDRNWERGQPAHVVFCHVISHLFAWIFGDRSDDHLGAGAWGLFTLMHFEERGPAETFGKIKAPEGQP